MVKYISRKTGAIIETECQLLGDWVKFEDRANDEEKVSSDVPDKVTDTPDVKQIVEVIVEEIDDSIVFQLVF